MSRDHVISVNGSSGVTFITGGKVGVRLELAQRTPAARPLAGSNSLSACLPLTRLRSTLSPRQWTTYREMAEHTVDRVIKDKKLAGAGPCVTKQVPLIGSECFKNNTNIKLVQKYGMGDRVAQHLVNTYGMRAYDVCELSKPTGKRYPRFGNLLVEGYPFIEAEIDYACAEYWTSLLEPPGSWHLP